MTITAGVLRIFRNDIERNARTAIGNDAMRQVVSSQHSMMHAMHSWAYWGNVPIRSELHRRSEAP